MPEETNQWTNVKLSKICAEILFFEYKYRESDVNKFKSSTG